MTWTRLDDGFWSNPKVVEAGNEAAGIYVRALAYCSQHLTEGRVPKNILSFIAARRTKPIDRLLEVGLITENGTAYLIPSYLEFNPTKAEVEAIKEKRAEAGRRGGRASGRSRQEAKTEASASANGEANA